MIPKLRIDVSKNSTKIFFDVNTLNRSIRRSAVMQLIRKSTLEANRMGGFENHVLLDSAFTQTHKHRKEILGKTTIPFQDILFGKDEKLTSPLRGWLRQNILKLPRNRLAHGTWAQPHSQ